MIDKKQIGESLRIARIGQNLSQEEFGKEFYAPAGESKTRQAVSLHEAGTSIPGAVTFLKIAQHTAPDDWRHTLAVQVLATLEPGLVEFASSSCSQSSTL